MNVKFLPILLLLICKTFSLTLNLGNNHHAKPTHPPHQNSLQARFAKLQMAKQRYEQPHKTSDNFQRRRRLGESDDLDDKEYPRAFEMDDDDEEDEKEEQIRPVISRVEDRSTLNFETQEIRDAVSFIEFKISEINVLIQECINEQFELDIMADVFVVKHQCVGTTFQILYFNYREGMKKLKDILLELLKIKLQQLDDIYEDEANFFIDMLDQLIDMDYDLPQSILVAKRASRFYVSPRFFDSLITIARPELKAFHKIHKRLREARNEIQANLEAHEHKQEEYIENLEQKAEVYEAAEEPEQEPEEDEETEAENELEEVEDEPEESDVEEDESESPEEEEEGEEEEGEESQDADEESEPGESEAGDEQGSGAETEGDAEGGADKEAAGEGAVEKETAAEGSESQEGNETKPADGATGERKRKLIHTENSIHRNFYQKPTYTFKPWKAPNNSARKAAANSKVNALKMASNQIKFKNTNFRNKKHI
jgi:hypothetical protein